MQETMWPVVRLLFKGIWLYFMRERADGPRLTEFTSELRDTFKS